MTIDDKDSVKKKNSIVNGILEGMFYTGIVLFLIALALTLLLYAGFYSGSCASGAKTSVLVPFPKWNPSLELHLDCPPTQRIYE